jgi:uncharacterized membrane protein YhaH (DUF805 family)
MIWARNMPGKMPSTQTFLGMVDLWFGLSRPVNRMAYATSGLALAVVKYFMESIVITLFTGRWYSPLDFVNPILSVRLGELSAVPEWLPWVLAAWSIPFLWIAVSMSVRRASDAGMSPWCGLVVLLPFINLPAFVWLSCTPTRAPDAWIRADVMTDTSHNPQRVLFALGAGTLVGGILFALSILLLQDYGTSMFLLTPFLMGATAGFIYNSNGSRPWGATIRLACSTILCGELSLFVFAFEGAVCLVMALPLALILGMLGGIMGKAISEAARPSTQGSMIAILFVPLAAVGDAWFTQPPMREVSTTIEVHAPAEVVWKHVTSFSEITRPREWYFHLGIACPTQARIEGEGIGAIRYCEFTTGTFVEPITAWEIPHRLAFDVAEQPEPMIELSLRPGIHPPHLDDYLRSVRGEFRLIPVSESRTRLEGTTWYELRMSPQWYWCAWSDLVIHRIHHRVLRHIQELAERKAGDFARNP